ncbi:QRFP-like peptide receptor [Oculina patagonica]
MVDTDVLCFTVVYAITMLVALVGNALLIYIVWTKPSTRSLTSFLFVNMAVADLLSTIFVMPANMAHFYVNEMTVVEGKINCGFIYYAGFVSVTASILCLTVMAFDRFFAVVYPFRQSIWFRKPKIIKPVIWISSMALMSVVPFVHKSIKGKCRFVISLLPFWTYILLINYLLPLAIITILYSIVAAKLWLHQVPLDHGDSQRHQREQEIPKKKIVRMLVIVVAVFAVCWLPVHVFQMQWAVRMAVAWPPPLIYFCYWFSQANSAINPWLYIGLNGKMNAAFTKMIRCRRDENIQPGNTAMPTARGSK